MNFLAHIYLSGSNEQVMLGNFMADGIHGRPDDYPPGIQKGIQLHRAIDSFTDAHPIFRQGTKRLHSRYHHYAGVIMDIFYDHFLAKNWSDYHNTPLKDFVSDFYVLLERNYDVLTDRIKGMLPYMINQNWLVSYASVEGISKILSQMDSRTKNKSGMRTSVEELSEYYSEFEREFTEFFKEISTFAKLKLTELEKQVT